MLAMEHQSPANGRPKVRVPKLAVRNRSDDSIALSNEVSPATSVVSVSSQLLPVHDHRDRRDSGRALETTRPSQSKRKPPNPAKKDGGVFGFLTLKEPSTSAWEEYARQQKQQVTPGKSGVPRVSMQKLPDHVPKVNSKWDGLPDATKRTPPRTSQSSRRRGSSARRSIGEGGPSRSTNATGTPNHSSTSPVRVALPLPSQDPANSSSIAVPSNPGTTFDSGLIPVPSASRPTSTSIRPADVNPQPSSAPPRLLASRAVMFDPLQAELPPPPSVPLPALPCTVHELDSTAIPQLVASNSSQTLPTSPETSPQTPPVEQLSALGRRVKGSPDELGAFELADTAVHELPLTPKKTTTTSRTSISSPNRSRVMNFSRPSRPVIDTSRLVVENPGPYTDISTPSGFSPPHNTRSVPQPHGPVELPCSSTLSPLPETPPPRARAKGSFEAVKIGRFSSMLGRR